MAAANSSPRLLVLVRLAPSSSLSLLITAPALVIATQILLLPITAFLSHQDGALVAATLILLLLGAACLLSDALGKPVQSLLDLRHFRRVPGFFLFVI